MCKIALKIVNNNLKCFLLREREFVAEKFKWTKWVLQQVNNLETKVE